MGTCAICGKGGDGVSTLGASHKELGWIMVCQDCWKNLSNTNSMVAGSSCTGKCAACAR
jgi:hypothetical protein